MKPLTSDRVNIIRFLIETAHRYAGLDSMKYLKRGEYVNITWSEVLDVTKAFSLGFQALGVKKLDRVALMSKTRYEWRLVDYGILFAGATTVTIYPSLTAAQVEYIINDSNSTIIVVDSVRNLKKVLSVRANCSGLKYVLCISPFPQEMKSENVFGLNELVEKGEKYERTNKFPPTDEAYKTLKKIEKNSRFLQKSYDMSEEIEKKLEELHQLYAKFAELTKDPFITRYLEVDDNDICTIVYTSGTTGVPKGALLTHYNMAYNSKQTLEVLPLKQHDIALGFLPLSHVLERQVGQFMATSIGYTIAYARDTDSLIENLDQIKPTFIVSVPRIYEKLYDRVTADILSDDSETKQKIFDHSCDWGWDYQRIKQEGEKTGEKINVSNAAKNWIAEKLVFDKINKKLGGRLRFMFSGGAALNPVIAKFFFSAGFKILEGYGLTETSPVLTINRIDCIKFGTIGPTIPDTKIKIAEDKEILASGPQVFQGYWNKPEENAVAFSEDEEGKWYHTGDTGEIDEDGYLKITGRKKTVIVLRTGKKVSPVVTEAAIVLDRHINHACVIGDDMKYLVGIIEPNFEYLAETLEQVDHFKWKYKDLEIYKGMSKEEFAHAMERRKQIVEMPEVIELYNSIITESQKNLSGFERIKNFALVPEEWNEYNVLTPSLKMKRKDIVEKYADLVKKIYVE